MSQENNTEIFLKATTSPSTNRNLPEKQQTEEPACLFFHTLSPIAPLKCFYLLRWNKAEQGTISAFIHLSFSTNLHETVLVCPHYLHTKVYQNTEANTASTKSYAYTDDTIYAVNLPYSEKKEDFLKGKKKRVWQVIIKKQAFRDLYLQLSDLYFKRKHFFLISNNPCSTHT